MMKQILFNVVCLSVIAATLASSCTNPKIEVKTFTNDDATILTHIAFVAEFSVTCGNGASELNLYADIGNNLVPVSRTSDSKYQVSWVEDVATASSGYRQIALFDEEGNAAYRKALRANEPIADVPTVGSFNMVHPGAYQGPWLKSEFIAAALSFFVAYMAFSSRAKLLA